MKKNTTCVLTLAGLFTLAFLLSLHVQGDAPSIEEQGDAQNKKLGITPDQAKTLRARSKELEQEVQMATKSPEGVAKLQATLRQAIAHIDAASTPVASDGNKLPSSFVDLFSPKNSTMDPPETSMMKSGFMGLKADNLSDQQTLSTIWMVMQSNPEIVLPLLQERAATLPPTAADYMIYGFSLEGLQDAPTDNLENKPDQVALPQGIGLLNLSHAKNPIYRLLAVRAVGFVEANQTNQVNFYSTFLNEPDPTIQTSAVIGLAGTKTPATLAALQSFQAAAQQNGNTRAVKVAEEAIQRLSKKPQ